MSSRQRDVPDIACAIVQGIQFDFRLPCATLEICLGEEHERYACCTGAEDRKVDGALHLARQCMM